MALLFALDRAGAAEDLRRALATHDLVLLDRYVASNAAYGAARTHQHADGAFATWIGALEFDRLRVPIPDLQILLDVPVALAAERATAPRRGGRRAVNSTPTSATPTCSSAPRRCTASWRRSSLAWRVVGGDSRKMTRR